MRAYSAKEISHFNANIAMKDLIKISITSNKFHHINHIDMLFCFMDHLVSFIPIFDSKNLKEEITHQDIQFATIAYIRSCNGFFLFSIFTFFATESRNK